jgi:hypothetical protein
VSTSTGRCSELSAEHKIRYTVIEGSYVNTMSKTSEVTGGLYGLVVGMSSPNIRQEFLSAYSRKRFRPSRGHPRVPVRVFGVDFASQQYGQYPAETDGQVRSDQWAGRREVNRKDFHRSAGHCDLNGSRFQVGQARNGH